MTTSGFSGNWWPSWLGTGSPQAPLPHQASHVDAPTPIQEKVGQAAASVLAPQEDDLDAFFDQLSSEVASVGSYGLAVPAGLGALIAYGYAKLYPEATSNWIRFALHHGAGIGARHTGDAEIVQENLQVVSEKFLELVGIKGTSHDTNVASSLIDLAVGTSKLFGAGHGATLEKEWEINRQLWMKEVPDLLRQTHAMSEPVSQLYKKIQALESAQKAHLPKAELQQLKKEKRQALREYEKAKKEIVKTTGQALSLLMPACANWLTDKEGRKQGEISQIVQYMSDTEIDALCGQLQRVVTSDNIEAAVESIRKIDILPQLLVFAWNKRLAPRNKEQYMLTFHTREEKQQIGPLTETDEDILRQIMTTRSQDEAIKSIQKFIGARVPQISTFLAQVTGDKIPSEYQLTIDEQKTVENAVKAMIEAPIPAAPGKDADYNRLRSLVKWFGLKKTLGIPEKYEEVSHYPKLRQIPTENELQTQVQGLPAAEIARVTKEVDQLLDALNSFTHKMQPKVCRKDLRTQVCLDRAIVSDPKELSATSDVEVVQLLKFRKINQQFYIQRDILRNALILAALEQDPVLKEALCRHVLGTEKTETFIADITQKITDGKQNDKKQTAKGLVRALLVTTLDPATDQKSIVIEEAFAEAARNMTKATLAPGIRIVHGTLVPEKYRITDDQLKNFIEKAKELIDATKSTGSKKEREKQFVLKGMKVAAGAFPLLQKVLHTGLGSECKVELTEKNARLCEKSLEDGDLSGFVMNAFSFIVAPLADQYYVNEIAKEFGLTSVLERYLPKLVHLTDEDSAYGLADNLLRDYATVRKIDLSTERTLSTEVFTKTLDTARQNALLGHQKFADDIVAIAKKVLSKDRKQFSELKQPVSLDRFLVEDPHITADSAVFVITKVADRELYLSADLVENQIELALLKVCQQVQERLDMRFGEGLTLDEKTWAAAKELTPTLKGLLSALVTFEKENHLSQSAYFTNKDVDRRKMAKDAAETLVKELLGPELESLEMPLLTRHVLMELLVGDYLINKEAREKYSDTYKPFLAFIRGGLDGVIKDVDKEQDMPILTRLIENKIDNRLRDPEYLSKKLHEQLQEVIKQPQFQEFDIVTTIAATFVKTVFSTLFPFLYPKKRINRPEINPHLRDLVATTSEVALRELRPKIAQSWAYKLARKFGAVDAAYDSLTLSIQESVKEMYEKKLQCAESVPGSVKKDDLFFVVHQLIAEDAPEPASTKGSWKQQLTEDVTQVYMKGGFIAQSKTVPQLVTGALGWGVAASIKGLFLSVPEFCSHTINEASSRFLSFFSTKVSRTYKSHVTQRVDTFWHKAKASFDHIGHKKEYERAQKEVDYVTKVLLDENFLNHAVATLIPECVGLLHT